MAQRFEVGVTLNYRHGTAAFGATMAKRQWYVLKWLRELHEDSPEAVELFEDDLDNMLNCQISIRIAYPGAPDAFEGVTPYFVWYEEQHGVLLFAVTLDKFDLRRMIPNPPDYALTFLVVRPGTPPQLVVPEAQDADWWPEEFRAAHEPLPPAIRNKLIPLAN